MRTKIIILIQIILLIIFLRSDYAQHFFSPITQTVSAWYHNILEVPERQKIMTLRDRFMRNNMSLQPHQVDYVFDITDSAETVIDFYALYCVKKDKNPFLYGDNLNKICKDIQRSELLSTHVL